MIHGGHFRSRSVLIWPVILHLRDAIAIDHALTSLPPPPVCLPPCRCGGCQLTLVTGWERWRRSATLRSTINRMKRLCCCLRRSCFAQRLAGPSCLSGQMCVAACWPSRGVAPDGPPGIGHPPDALIILLFLLAPPLPSPHSRAPSSVTAPPSSTSLPT